MDQQDQSPFTDRRLYRSESDRYIAGVAGGLGEYLQIDPTIVRIVFLIAAFWGGLGILVYVLMWFMVPSRSDLSQRKTVEDTVRANAQEMKERAESLSQRVRIPEADDSSRRTLGFLVLVVGVLLLLSNFGVLAAFELGRLWPIFLVFAGFLLLTRR